MAENPNSRAIALRSRESAARQRARAQWTDIRARRGYLHAFGIAQKRFSVRQEPVRKQNRLRVLHVRHAWHGHLQMGFRLNRERFNQFHQSLTHGARRCLHEHPEFRGDHLIAAPASVQFGADGPERGNQRHFHKMMHIFCI